MYVTNGLEKNNLHIKLWSLFIPSKMIMQKIYIKCMKNSSFYTG